MKKYTTYYLDTEVVEALDREKNKSAIVNEIMRKHYLNFKKPSSFLAVDFAVEDTDRGETRPRCEHGYPKGECLDKKKNLKCM